MKVLEIKNIKKSFNDQTLHVLKDISLSGVDGKLSIDIHHHALQYIYLRSIIADDIGSWKRLSLIVKDSTSHRHALGRHFQSRNNC